MHAGGLVERMNGDARSYAELAYNAEILLRELHRLQSQRGHKPNKEVMRAMRETRKLLERT